MSDSLIRLGWDKFFEEHFLSLRMPDVVPARVVSQSRSGYRVTGEEGELSAVLSGKLRDLGAEAKYRPVVGDWVALSPVAGERKGVIQAVLPRRSQFSRKAAGEKTEEQVVAANVDTVFIVSGLDGGRNLNIRRIERYITLAWNSGASPAIILNKADLSPDTTASLRDVAEIAAGIPVHVASAKDGSGVEDLRRYIGAGRTAAFLGSSGVGKSTLINALLGSARQVVGEVKADDRTGRHTTTQRELFLLPEGGMVIDTPGMREIQIWGTGDDVQSAFHDIEALSRNCRFDDCAHQLEPGCAVRQAVENGELSRARLDSFVKLQKEAAYTAARQEGSERLFEKARGKKIARMIKEIQKDR